MPTDQTADEQTTNQTTQEPQGSDASVTPSKASQSAQNGEGGGEAQGASENGSDGFESLPESWQEQIRSLRSENARRRTSEKELRERLEKAKTDDDIQKAVSEYKARNEELERELLFTKSTAGIPEDYLSLVNGSTEEEIKASADKVRALLARQNMDGTDDRQLNGGSDPRSNEAPKTPRELSREARAFKGTSFTISR